MKVKHLAGVFFVFVFALTTTVVFAAGENWVVIKDKNGVCKVIEAKEKTPATIAGPFKSREAAEKAKAKECPKDAGSAADKKKEKAEEQAEKAKTRNAK
jgi:hypothetical protein